MFYYKKLFLMDIVDCWVDIDFSCKASGTQVDGLFFIIAGQRNAIYHTLQLNITNCLAIIVFFWLIFQTGKNTNLDKLLNAFLSWICIPVIAFHGMAKFNSIIGICHHSSHNRVLTVLEIFYVAIFLEKIQIFLDTSWTFRIRK